MEEKRRKKIKADPLFDGHLEKDVTKMSPEEKLLYLSRQIRFKHFIDNKVRRIPKRDL